MKLVDHAGLMAMPSGTVFQEFGKQGLGEPQVFGESLGEGVDYTAAGLLPAENSVSIFGNNKNIHEEFDVTDSDYAIWYPSGFGRDGSFDGTRHYLIWEQDDRDRIAEWLLDPAKALAEMNDSPHELLKVDWKLRGESI